MVCVYSIKFSILSGMNGDFNENCDTTFKILLALGSRLGVKKDFRLTLRMSMYHQICLSFVCVSLILGYDYVHEVL